MKRRTVLVGAGRFPLGWEISVSSERLNHRKKHCSDAHDCLYLQDTMCNPSTSYVIMSSAFSLFGSSALSTLDTTSDAFVLSIFVCFLLLPPPLSLPSTPLPPPSCNRALGKHSVVWNWLFFAGEVILTFGVWTSHLQRSFPSVRCVRACIVCGLELSGKPPRCCTGCSKPVLCRAA